MKPDMRKAPACVTGSQMNGKIMIGVGDVLRVLHTYFNIDALYCGMHSSMTKLECIQDLACNSCQVSSAYVAALLFWCRSN